MTINYFKLRKIVFFLLILSSFLLNEVKGFSKLSISLALTFLLFQFLNLKRIFLSKEYTLLFIFLIFNIFSLFWGGNIDYITQTSSAIIIGYAVFSGLRWDMPTSTLLKGMSIAAVLNIILSYKNILYFQVAEENRVMGLVGNANALAILLLFVAFSLYFLSSKRRLRLKVFVSFLLLFAVFYTGSRKGLLFALMLVLFIGFDYLKWQTTRLRSRRFIIICLILTLFLIIAFKWASEASNDIMALQRAEALLRGEDRWSAMARYAMINEGIKLWLQKPFFGWGGGGFSMNSSFYTYSHNNYIELLSNYGLIGFCLYYSFYIYLFLNGWRNRKEYFPRIGLLIVIIFLILEWGFVSLGDKTSSIFLGLATFCILFKRGYINENRLIHS